MLRAQARVNVAAIERNVSRLRAQLTPGTALCAAVKADGYGHGAAAVGHAALSAGATWLALATGQEAVDLRAAGIDARLLVMGALTQDELDLALQADADVVAWDEGFVRALRGRGARVHVKLDTGMGRLGTADPARADAIADLAAGTDGVQLVGAMTHLATADALDDSFIDVQLERFRAWAQPLRERHPGTILHVANSAALLRDPASHFDLVRPGVAVYGLDPFQGDPAVHGLEPALELRSYVASIKRLAPGDSVGYGRRFVATAPTTIATLPIGYGDGVRRGLSGNDEVLVDGRLVPVVGTISMDNLAVDLGPDRGGIAVGAEAVLIGPGLPAEAMARRLGTINYEVTCGIAARVPRWHHRDGAPA